MPASRGLGGTWNLPWQVQPNLAHLFIEDNQGPSLRRLRRKMWLRRNAIQTDATLQASNYSEPLDEHVEMFGETSKSALAAHPQRLGKTPGRIKAG
jgi:hypothetical protein